MTPRAVVLVAVLTCSLLYAPGGGAQECDEEAMLALDADGDGIPDVVERFLGTDPDAADTDRDGVVDGLELDTLGTSPLNPDSDLDGLCDGGRDVEPYCVAGEDWDENGVIEAERDETDPRCTADAAPFPPRTSVRGTALFTCGASDASAGLWPLVVLAVAVRRRRRRRHCAVYPPSTV